MRFWGQPGGIHRNSIDLKGPCQQKPRNLMPGEENTKKYGVGQRAGSLGKLEEI